MKKVLFILFILLLAGCSTTYRLEIRDDVIKERILINDTTAYFAKNKFYAIMDGSSNFVEYNKKTKNNNTYFSHNYSFDEFSKATVLKTCFDAYNIVEDGDYYILSTSQGIKCAIEEDRTLLDDLTIVIKTNHVVKENNSNSKSANKNEYIWKFDKNDYDNASISMKLYKDKFVFNYNNEFVIQVGIITVITLTILIIIFIIRNKVKKANRL